MQAGWKLRVILLPKFSFFYIVFHDHCGIWFLCDTVRTQTVSQGHLLQAWLWKAPGMDLLFIGNSIILSCHFMKKILLKIKVISDFITYMDNVCGLRGIAGL